MPEEKRQEFVAKAKDLMEWLCANGHPHMTIVITPTRAELLEVCAAVVTDEFLRD